MIERIIVAGGGTGGHLFPGIAVVEELRRRNPDLEVAFVGTERGIEARVIPALGEKLELIEVQPLKGRSTGQLLRSVMMLPGAAAQAMRILSAHRPDLVVGVGGYAAGPMLAAAAARGVPTAVLEQNAFVGLTNRMLAPVVGRAYVTFPETAGRFRSGRVVVSGNPVRRAFVDAARRAQSDPEGSAMRARRVFVLGGSQGAQALNETVPEALAHAGLAGRGIQVLHQAGVKMRDEVEARYRDLGVEAEVVSFIDDMASAYASAAVVIARAGATTVAELCAMGRPSVLVPYPHAANDHQRKNAEALERDGAAVCIPQPELEPAGLARMVEELLDDDARRASMAEAALRLGRPEQPDAVEVTSTPTIGGGGGAGGEGPDTERRISLRGERPYVPALSSRARPRRSSIPAHRRPVLVYGLD